MAKSCIGIDLGGTFMKFGLLNDSLQVSGFFQLPTPTDRGPEGVIEEMVRGARKLIQDQDIKSSDVLGVGIGSPGPIRQAEGIVIAMPNIPCIRNLPMRDLIAESLGIQAVLENDANAAAYGEFLCGAGQGREDIILLTLGTGVGSGIIIDGKIVHGSHDIGAEIGHIIIEPGGEQCGCGQQGCLERYCSAKYLALRAQRMIEAGHQSSMKEILTINGTLTSKDVYEARQTGDRLATAVWDTATYYLALACVSICRLFDPDEIVLAGGLSKAGDELMQPLRRHYDTLHWKLTKPLTRITITKLGSDAGAIGAAGVAWSKFGRINIPNAAEPLII